MKTKSLCKLLAAAVGISCLSGCGGKQMVSENSDVTLRYWTTLTSYASTVVNNLGDTPLMKEAQKRTGVKLQFEHPPQGQAKEKFNILVASDNLPDIIQYNWEQSYPGGPQKALNDKIIVDINAYKSSAPNLFSFLEKNDMIKKLATTDNGSLFAFPFIRTDLGLRVMTGPIIRQDWLEDLGLEVPETIEEWETVLTAFRDKKGASAPLSVSMYNLRSSHAFVGAYGTMLNYYIEDGKVKHGYAEPALRDFIVLMNRWYSEKLLDQDFASLEDSAIDSNILNGDSGAVINNIGRGIGRYMAAAPSEGYKLCATKYPVLKKGETPQFSRLTLQVPPTSTSYAAISIDSQHKEEAARFLDYGYTEEGQMLYNFGIEGESYEMIDGYPTYTEKITKNPDGLDFTTALSQYTYAYDAGPTIQDLRYMEQYAARPEQKDAWEKWSITDMDKHLAPNLPVLPEEVNEYANLDNAVGTYLTEMTLKLIMGVEPLEKFDEMIRECKSRGLDRLIEMKQASYDRFMTK